MNPVRRKRLILISIMIAGVGSAVGFALYAFNQNMMFYYSPTEVMTGMAPALQTFIQNLGLTPEEPTSRLTLNRRAVGGDSTRILLLESRG